MSDFLSPFEQLVRGAKHVGSRDLPEHDEIHPFDKRNIHADIASVSLKLFDNGHYSQATFEAFKLLDTAVSEASSIQDSGFALMMAAFDEKKPKIKLNSLQKPSDRDEQLGFRHVFAGSMSAIRNPRAHDIRTDPIDLCLDHLSFASMLLRTLGLRRFPPTYINSQSTGGDGGPTD